VNSRASVLKELLAERRSVRRFEPDPVPEDVLREVLDAGRLAPSPTNSQPWSFLVLSGDAIRTAARILADRVPKVAVPGFQAIAAEAARIIADAPHVITVWNVGRLSRRLRKIQGLIGPAFGRSYERAERDGIACACENMWLMAHALGLGMVWIMVDAGCAPAFRRAFGVEGTIAALLPLGRPAPGAAAERTGRKPLTEIVRFFDGEGPPAAGAPAVRKRRS
jgi:nicotinate-nucleotide--dimethylbenzimidazole phosphoribosyltransferase